MYMYMVYYKPQSSSFRAGCDVKHTRSPLVQGSLEIHVPIEVSVVMPYSDANKRSKSTEPRLANIIMNNA